MGRKLITTLSLYTAEFSVWADWGPGMVIAWCARMNSIPLLSHFSNKTNDRLKMRFSI